jgi:hypothetical protein
MTLIDSGNDFALMAALFVIAGAAFLAEKTRLGSHLTGAVIAILADRGGQPAHNSSLGPSV